MRRNFIPLAMLAASVFFVTRRGAAQSPSEESELLHVRGNIYMLAGAGANITLSAGPDGVFVVDSGGAGQTEKVLAAVHTLRAELHARPIRYIVNTSMLADHTGGNETLAGAGITYTGGNITRDLAGSGEGAAIIAHENVLRRMSDAQVPFKAQPTETYFGRQMKLSHFMNGEGIRLVHFSAVTDGDSLVYFRGSDVISPGEIFSTENFPPIDVARGGSVQGVLDGLNYMLDLIVSDTRVEGGTFVIPARGRISDNADVAYYRDMVTIVRDRVQDLIKKGMSLAQVIAARPAEDWESRLGKADAFVEAVYLSLQK